MGFLDEFKKLTHPMDDEDDDDFLDEAEEMAEPQSVKRRNPFAGFAFGAPAQEEDEPAAKPAAAAAPVRQGKGKVVNFAGGSSGAMQLMLAKPERFEAAAEIADNLRDGRAVLMNLETTTKEVARRLIDFLSGVAYAMGGKIKKVSANTYIITPTGVNLMGDLMDELESTGFYF